MPTAPAAPCGAPGCHERRPCPVHGQSASQQAYNRQRGSSSQQGYGGSWPRIRAQQLRLEPLCQRCLAGGVVTEATDVNHVVPVDEGGSYTFDNLESLCARHHGQETRRQHSVGGPSHGTTRTRS